MSELDKAAMFLAGSEPIQVLQALQSLPTLVDHYGRSTFITLLAPINRKMGTLDPETSMALAQSFSTIVEQRLLQTQDLLTNLAPIMLLVIKTPDLQPEVRRQSEPTPCLMDPPTPSSEAPTTCALAGDASLDAAAQAATAKPRQADSRSPTPAICPREDQADRVCGYSLPCMPIAGARPVQSAE